MVRFNYSLLNEFYNKYSEDNIKIRQDIIKDFNCYTDINAMDIISIRKTVKKTLLQTVIATHNVPNKFELIEFLICNGHDINQKDANGKDILDYAVTNGDINIVNMIFCYKEYKVDLNHLTVLMRDKTTYNRYVSSDIYELLRSHGGKIDPDHIIDQMSNGDNFNNFAKTYINIILNDFKLDINHVTPNGNCIYSGMLFIGLFNEVKELITKYPNLNINLCNILPMSIHNEDMMFYLIEKGANINGRNRNGSNILYDLVHPYKKFSFTNKDVALIEKLIALGADVNLKYDGKTSLFMFMFQFRSNITYRHNYVNALKIADKFPVTPQEINTKGL